MKVLLLSMPDAIPLFYSYKSHVPNLGIRSIAGNLDAKGAEVKYLDLIFFHRSVSKIIKEAIREFRPHLIGISCMTFQYDTALKVAGIIKQIDSRIKIAIGGYHATVMYREIPESESPFDYLIRNEGERSFAALVRALAGGNSDLNRIKGLSFKEGSGFVHNEQEDLLDLDELKIPRRDLNLFKFPKQVFKGRVEAVETSRGCTMGCSFCSIANMYGRNFRRYSIQRVIDDIQTAKDAGANRIIFVDDNMTLDVKRIENICEGIIEAGLNDLYYAVQLSSRGVAQSEALAKKMGEANFSIVFLGIENISKDRLEKLGKGDIIDETKRAISYLHKYDIGIMGGFILGNPDDDANDIKACFKFAKKAKVDMLMAQYLTPYPKTKLRETMLQTNLVEHRTDYSRYNGFQPVARTKYMTLKELERCMVMSNIIWYIGEIFNPYNWFVRSKKVPRHVYFRIVIMTLAMIIDFARGRYGKSFHRI